MKKRTLSEDDLDRAEAMFPEKSWKEIAKCFDVAYSNLYWRIQQRRKRRSIQPVSIGETGNGSAHALIGALERSAPQKTQLAVNSLDAVEDRVMISISVSDSQLLGILAKLKPESRANVARFAVQELVNS